jgi:hypothetical protein
MKRIAYHKTLRNKNAASYSAEDLNAIMMGSATIPDPDADVGTKRRRAPSLVLATTVTTINAKPGPGGATSKVAESLVGKADDDSKAARKQARRERKQLRKAVQSS